VIIGLTRREFIQLILCSGATAVIARVPFVQALTPYVVTPPLPVLTIPFGIGGAVQRGRIAGHRIYIPVVKND
jgi:hypothetical protein